MAIKFRFAQGGAFVAGDTETGLTSYAYPSSTYAEQAARSDKWAAKIAAKMVRKLKGNPYRDEYDLRNWWRINTGEDPRAVAPVTAA